MKYRNVVLEARAYSSYDFKVREVVSSIRDSACFFFFLIIIYLLN